MASKSSWTIYETAILIDYYIKFKERKITRKEVLDNTSKELRELAISQGKEIDNLYRNIYGISIQLDRIEKIFKQNGTGSSEIPQVFTEVVSLYINDRDSYDKLFKGCVKFFL